MTHVKSILYTSAPTVIFIAYKMNAISDDAQGEISNQRFDTWNAFSIDLLDQEMF